MRILNDFKSIFFLSAYSKGFRLLVFVSAHSTWFTLSGAIDGTNAARGVPPTFLRKSIIPGELVLCIAQEYDSKPFMKLDGVQGEGGVVLQSFSTMRLKSAGLGLGQVAEGIAAMIARLVTAGLLRTGKSRSLGRRSDLVMTAWGLMGLR